MDTNTTENQFFEYANDLVVSPAIDHAWSEDRLTISFPKKNENGFDIEVTYDPISKIIGIQTDRGYHDHFHIDRFDTISASFERVFGLVRDLLTQNMRIEETLTNGRPRKWSLQAHVKGNWITESTTGLLFWNIFGNKSTVV